jgi:hypothetical protein
MVKFGIPVQFSAHDEAQYRTVGVSMKPAIGKELFSLQDLGAESGGAFSGHFETERFIHSKVRPYLLRSADHCRSVQIDLSNLNAAYLVDSNDDCSIFSPTSDVIAFKMIHSKVNDLSFQTISDSRKPLTTRPKDLFEVSNGLYVKSGTSLSKGITSHTQEASKYSFRCRVFLCQEDGFGTAPIWYQQSMATGPPG